EGPIAFMGLFSYAADYELEQLDQDTVTKSEFSATLGSISNNATTAVLTLTTAATGTAFGYPMWEGEVLECNPSAPFTCALPQGAEIVSLASGTWGANGSTYNVTAPNFVIDTFTGSVTAGAMTISAGAPSFTILPGTIISGTGLTGCPTACPT